jgi:hypothetical protein
MNLAAETHPPVYKTDDEEFKTSHPRLSVSVKRLSSLIPKVTIPRFGTKESTHGHRQSRSESILSALYTRTRNVGLPLRRTHSETHSLEGSHKEHQVGHNEDVRSQDREGLHGGDFEPAYDESRLVDQLVVALVKAPCTNHEFIPKGKLDKLVTQDSVTRELSRKEYLGSKIRHRTWRPAGDFYIGSSSDRTHATCVQWESIQSFTPSTAIESFQQVFAILMLIGRPKRIWSFVKEGVCDADLPLLKKRQDPAGGIYELRRRVDLAPPLRCLKKPNEISWFVAYQWCVLAPSFGPSDKHRVPHGEALKGQILPFVHWENRSRQGGSAEIHKAEVHPDHHDFDKNEASGHPSRRISLIVI